MFDQIAKINNQRKFFQNIDITEKMREIFFTHQSAQFL